MFLTHLHHNWMVYICSLFKWHYYCINYFWNNSKETIVHPVQYYSVPVWYIDICCNILNLWKSSFTKPLNIENFVLSPIKMCQWIFNGLGTFAEWIVIAVSICWRLVSPFQFNLAGSFTHKKLLRPTSCQFTDKEILVWDFLLSVLKNRFCFYSPLLLAW